MKTIATFLITFLFALPLCAQEFTTYVGDGKIVLSDGKVLEGSVDYTLSFPATVHIRVGEGKREKYKAEEVKEFTVGAKHYFSVKFKGEIIAGDDKAFAYLLSADNAKIKLFKYETQPIVTTGTVVTTTVSLYAGLPESGNEVYPLSHLSLNPSKKLAKYYEDCAALAQKITNKEKGFSYGMITTDGDRFSVIEKYNNEYVSCK